MYDDRVIVVLCRVFFYTSRLDGSRGRNHQRIGRALVETTMQGTSMPIVYIQVYTMWKNYFDTCKHRIWLWSGHVTDWNWWILYRLRLMEDNAVQVQLFVPLLLFMKFFNDMYDLLQYISKLSNNCWNWCSRWFQYVLWMFVVLCRVFPSFGFREILLLKRKSWHSRWVLSFWY